MDNNYIVAEVISELPICEGDCRSELYVRQVADLLIMKLNKYKVIIGRFEICDLLDAILQNNLKRKS